MNSLILILFYLATSIKAGENYKTNSKVHRPILCSLPRGVITGQATHRRTSLIHPTIGYSLAAASSTPTSPAGISNAPKSDAIKRAINNTIFTMILTAIFWLGTWYVKGQESGLEFITGFLVEKSLSVDNLFVFLMLFDYFKIPDHLQNRVLTWGLIGAIAMRGVMIYFGIEMITKFRWILLLFSGILFASSFKLLSEKHEESDHNNDNDNFILKLVQRLIPSVPYLDGEKFFVKINAVQYATPLFTCLLCIELSDFVFAVDSIPAVIGVSKDPFIVYSSNIFAIMGLRSLYILLAHIVTKLKYVRPSIALVLMFVAGKMIAEYFHVEISSATSLTVIGLILFGGIAASLLGTDNQKQQQPHSQK